MLFCGDKLVAQADITCVCIRSVGVNHH
jgi:hypothetical protein